MGGDLKKFLKHKTSHFYSIISPEKMKHLSLQTKIFLFWPDGPLNVFSTENYMNQRTLNLLSTQSYMNQLYEPSVCHRRVITQPLGGSPEPSVSPNKAITEPLGGSLEPSVSPHRGTTEPLSGSPEHSVCHHRGTTEQLGGYTCNPQQLGLIFN